MKKLITLFSIIALVGIAGCGGGEEGGATVVMKAKMSTGEVSGSASSIISQKAILDDDPTSNTNIGNPYLEDILLTPEKFGAAFIKVEVGTVPDISADEETRTKNFTPSFTIYEQPTIDEAEYIDITSPVNISNKTACAEGTFNAFRIQVLFLQMTLSDDDVDFGEGLGKYTFREFTTKYSGGGSFGSQEIRDGDIMVEQKDGKFMWVGEDDGSLYDERPANPVQELHFAGKIVEHSKDPLYTDVGGIYVFQPVVVIDPPLEITSCESGTYTFTATFNVEDTFFFDKCDNDKIFEPASDEAKEACKELGGGQPPEWFAGPPAVSATYSSE